MEDFLNTEIGIRLRIGDLAETRRRARILIIFRIAGNLPAHTEKPLGGG